MADLNGPYGCPSSGTGCFWGPLPKKQGKRPWATLYLLNKVLLTLWLTGAVLLGGHISWGLLDAVQFGRWGHTKWCDRPFATNHLHSDGLLDAIPLHWQPSKSGAVEVLHQLQVPCPHHHCRFLGCDTNLHAAVDSELLRWRDHGSKRLLQWNQEQTNEIRWDSFAAIKFSYPVCPGDLHWGDCSVLREALP